MVEGYICCFCGQSITRQDDAAVQLVLQNLWHSGDPDHTPGQAVYAHSACAAKQMAAGQVSPEVLLTEQGYSVQEILWGENEGPRGRFAAWGCLGLLLALCICLYLSFVR